jgi:hypothetical protein
LPAAESNQTATRATQAGIVRATLVAALLAGITLGAGTAAAWGPAGHRAVGAVADQLLTPVAQAAVQQLLVADRDRAGRYSGRHNLADVADWPDEIRGTPGDQPHWHYDNRPICGAPKPPAAWCPGGDCASAQLPALLAVLADDGRTRAERNVALKWVVHLAGDLHQPLHAADLAEGANRIRIAQYGRPPHARARGAAGWDRGDGSRRGRSDESLHAFWDSNLVNLALHPTDGNIPDGAMADLLRRARAADPASVDAPPERWAEESNDIARHFALSIDGVDCAIAGALDAGQGPRVTLTREYVARGREMVQERIALAGARLARVINLALDAGD